MYGSYNNTYGGQIDAYQQQQYQNRLAQLEQQYGYRTPPSYQSNSNLQQVIKGRPVSSFDEAKASMIDLDGSLFVFTDVANKCIYTKQITLNGTAELKTYKLVEEQIPVNVQGMANKQEFVLREDFEKTVNGLIQEIARLKGGMTNDETGNDANVK